MEITIPTTKQEMFDTLRELYYYYRIRRDGYEQADLRELELEKMIYLELTEQELYEKAQLLLSAENEQFKREYLNKLQLEIDEIDCELEGLPTEKQTAIEKTVALYTESQRQAELKGIKNGLGNSSIVLDKWTELEREKNKKITGIETDYLVRENSLNTKRIKLCDMLEQAETYCSFIATEKVRKKVDELKSEQDKLVREVFKYNNGIDEKLQRYRNTIVKENAELLLKFMEIRNGEYTKSELVEMGYYERVMNTVFGYYDSLDTLVAAREVADDHDLIIYLDDYYQTVLYTYQQRAIYEKSQNNE